MLPFIVQSLLPSWTPLLVPPSAVVLPLSLVQTNTEQGLALQEQGLAALQEQGLVLQEQELALQEQGLAPGFASVTIDSATWGASAGCEGEDDADGDDDDGATDDDGADDDGATDDDGADADADGATDDDELEDNDAWCRVNRVRVIIW